MTLTQIGAFCVVNIGEIFILYAGFKYQYRRGWNKIFALLIGEIPIAMLTVLPVTLTIGAAQLRLSSFESLRLRNWPVVSPSFAPTRWELSPPANSQYRILFN